MLLCWLSVGPQGTGKKSWSKIVRVTQNHANVKNKIACTHHLSHLALPILKVPFHILPTLTEPSTNASNCLEKLNYTSISMVMSSPFEKIITSQVPWGFRLCFPLVISGAIFEKQFLSKCNLQIKVRATRLNSREGLGTLFYTIFSLTAKKIMCSLYYLPEASCKPCWCQPERRYFETSISPKRKKTQEILSHTFQQSALSLQPGWFSYFLQEYVNIWVFSTPCKESVVGQILTIVVKSVKNSTDRKSRQKNSTGETVLNLPSNSLKCH